MAEAVIFAAITSAASGAVAYMGAQRQASQLEQQANSATLRAEANAKIQYNNAVAAAQDETYQQSVNTFNSAENNALMNRMLSDKAKKDRMSIAAAEAQGAKQGVFNYSFSDTLKSDMMLSEGEGIDILAQGKQKSYEYKSANELSELRKSRGLEMGKYSSALTLSEGRQQSAALNAQASATRIGGYASALGSFSQAGSYYSQKTP